MNRFKKYFSRFGGAFVKALRKVYRFAVSDEALDQISDASRRLTEIAEKVLPVVQLVASLTLTKADDKVVALAQMAQVSLMAFVGMSDEHKNAVLKASAVALARKGFPELQAVDDATLHAAIDIAYWMLKDLDVEE